MRLNEITQEIIEQNERIEELEQQLSELLEQLDLLNREAMQRRYRIQELMFEAVPDTEGEILSCADLLM